MSVFAFELLTHAAASEVSFMGINVTNLGLVERLLALEIAYLYYQLAATISYRRLLEEFHDSVLKKVLPEFYAKDMEFYGAPANSIPRRGFDWANGRRRLWQTRRFLGDAVAVSDRSGPRLLSRLCCRPPIPSLWNRGPVGLAHCSRGGAFSCSGGLAHRRRESNYAGLTVPRIEKD